MNFLTGRVVPFQRMVILLSLVGRLLAIDGGKDVRGTTLRLSMRRYASVYPGCLG